eukprot:jgi/Mesvir1/13634/Mv02967-RA.1
MACAVYLEAKEGTPPSEDIFCGQIRRTPDGRVAAADIVKCIIYLREDGTYAREALEEPRIKQCESVKAAAAEISNTPRAQVDGKVYAKVFGIQNKSIMNMTADEFRHVQNMKKGDLVRDMWTEEMNSGAFFMNCVFRAAVAGGEDPVAAMERISRTMTPTFRGVGLHDQASTKRPREFLVHNKEMRESRHASHSTLEVPGQHSLKRVLTTNGDP